MNYLPSNARLAREAEDAANFGEYFPVGTRKLSNAAGLRVCELLARGVAAGEVARRLGLNLGDVINFAAGEERLVAVLASKPCERTRLDYVEAAMRRWRR